MLEKNASLMNDAITQRVSRRSFDGQPLSEEQQAALRQFTAEDLGVARLRTHFVHRSGGLDHVYRGVVGSYGKITGSSALLAFTAASDDTWAADMECGYAGEQYVLLAESLGLGSCWNGGMFGVKELMGLVPLGPHERVVSIIALGKAVTGEDRLGKLAKLVFRRKSVEQIASRALLEAPGYMRGALEAVRVAPSAVNRQPWFLDQGADGKVVLTATRQGGLVNVDLGIAMLHFRVSVLSQGLSGRWEAQSPSRAVFWLARETSP